MFKELFTEQQIKKDIHINEGTSATITVFDGKIYKTSIIYNDAGVYKMQNTLYKDFGTLKLAKQLVQKTGSIEEIDAGNVKYYTDERVLETVKTEKKALKNAMQEYLMYWFDGYDWLYAEGPTNDKLMYFDILEPD